MSFRPDTLSRRPVLKGVATLGLVEALGVSCSYAAASRRPGLVLSQRRGPYQNNGAVPWYSDFGLGTPAQSVKVALDTGTNFNWVSSVVGEAARGATGRPGGQEFDERRSTSFHLLDTRSEFVSFGPAGSMTVLTGTDDLRIQPATSIRQTFHLAKRHTGQQFLELDYDAGFAFPSSSRAMKKGISFLVADLMDAGLIDPGRPYVSFDWNAERGEGTCQIGGIDDMAFDPRSGIRMSWTPYRDFPDADYLWSTPLDQVDVSGTTVARDVVFALDTGSSQFKGDNHIMNSTRDLVMRSPDPVHLHVGTLMDGVTPGIIPVLPAFYNLPIQAGRGAGRVEPQFAPLGTRNLVLVGSVLMDHFYTVFEYSVLRGRHGYVLSAAAMYLFNKANGPHLLASVSRPMTFLGLAR